MPQEEQNGATLDERRSQVPVSATTVLVVTNLVKLGGLAVALNEALLRGTLRPPALALAAFMMAGAQGLESFMSSFLGKK